MLVAALEVERTAIGARVYFGIPQFDDLGTTRDGLPNVVIRVQIIARLVDIGQINGIPDGNRTFVRLFVTSNHFEQGRLTRAVRSDDADDTAGRQREFKVLNQQLVAHSLGQAFDLKHLATQTGTVGNNDLGTGQTFAL